MKCIRCKERAIINLRHHKAAFCRRCYPIYFRKQVERAIREERMMGPGDRVLVAVSGGKDSLSLWDVLIEMGYDAAGLYIHLGIGDYSERSREKVERYAQSRGARLIVEEVKEAVPTHVGMPELAAKSGRNACSACGMTKRYLFNRAALENGFNVVATGHNLDDEAARLLGNLLRWNIEFLVRQSPVLEGRGAALVKKVKPLYRLTEKETAGYAIIKGIDYIVEECPMAEGATSLTYKGILNQLENASPGAKLGFYTNFLKQGRPLLAPFEPDLKECVRCGQPTTGEVCAFCRMTARV